jgi:hypothetical protein
LSVIFFLGLYEIIWYQIAAHFFHYNLRIFEFMALAGWVFLCVREIYPNKPPKISLVFYALFVIIMVLWVGTGFAVNNSETPTFSISGEAFNVTSKTALAIAFAYHIGKKPL